MLLNSYVPFWTQRIMELAFNMLLSEQVTVLPEIPETVGAPTDPNSEFLHNTKMSAVLVASQLTISKEFALAPPIVTMSTFAIAWSPFRKVL